MKRTFCGQPLYQSRKKKKKRRKKEYKFFRFISIMTVVKKSLLKYRNWLWPSCHHRSGGEQRDVYIKKEKKNRKGKERVLSEWEPRTSMPRPGVSDYTRQKDLPLQRR